MAESVAIPSFQTLVQIIERFQDLSGQFFLREPVVTVPELLSDLGLVRALVLYDNVWPWLLRSVGRVIPSSLDLVSIILDTTFVALT